jgi:thiol-disulfide isomerase/thioredoxin
VPLFNKFNTITKNDEQQDVQQTLAENVNKRLEKAMGELKEKHKNGTNEKDDPDRAPTGTAYREIEQQQQAAAAAARQRKQQKELQEEQDRQDRQQLRVKVQQQIEDGVEEEDSDDEFDHLLDDDNDPILEAIRQKRLAEMKYTQVQRAENLAKGHGQYRTISQDEVLPECTGSSEWVAIHFFHKEFQRCHVIDHHLKQIAARHISCKFLRIDAEKAPFFVSKLVLRTLPTLIVFQDGKAVDRLVGFQGLTSPKDPDNFPTHKLQQWLADTGAIDFDITKDELAREELLQEQVAPGRNGRAIWSTAQQFDELAL